VRVLSFLSPALSNYVCFHSNSQSKSTFSNKMPSNTEVRQLHVSSTANQQIASFHISMNTFSIMKVLDATRQEFVCLWRRRSLSHTYPFNASRNTVAINTSSNPNDWRDQFQHQHTQITNYPSGSETS
jgi:hypothetical protein